MIIYSDPKTVFFIDINAPKSLFFQYFSKNFMFFLLTNIFIKAVYPELKYASNHYLTLHSSGDNIVAIKGRYTPHFKRRM